MNFEGFCSSPRHYLFNFPITFGNPEILLQSVWIAKNENWIATGLRNIKTSNFGCSDCTSTSMVQTMSDHTLSRWLQHCPALHWYWGHGHNPPVILIDCARTIWIAYDCENLRNRDCEELPPRFGGLRWDFNGLHAHNRLSNPKNRIAIHQIRSQS